MTVVLCILVALAFLALLACVALFTRDVQAEQRATREHLAVAARALAAQLARQHEEQHRHLDAAAAALVAQLAALPPASRPRPVPQVEVRAPPLHPTGTTGAKSPRCAHGPPPRTTTPTRRRWPPERATAPSPGRVVGRANRYTCDREATWPDDTTSRAGRLS